MHAIRRKKPVVLGEFGAFKSAEDSFKGAVRNLRAIRDLSREHGMAGWIMWTFDCFEQKRLYHAMEDHGRFIQKLGSDAPLPHGDPE